MLVEEIAVLALDIDGVLTDGRVMLSPHGEETKEIAFRDLDAIARVRRAGVKVVLVTGEDGPLVDAIAKRVGADWVVRAAKDKRTAIRTVAENFAVHTSRLCFVGDADRDAVAFSDVGLALAPSDASPMARAKAHRVLKLSGGAGAVAEAVGILLGAVEHRRRSPLREQQLRRIVEDSIAAHQQLLENSLPILGEIASALARTLRSGNKALFCGNGGSAADAQHVAGELIGRFAIEREPWPAIALTTDTSVLTAIGNDWSFENIFSRQVRALARPGDLVVGITTSGRSPNVVQALEAGRERGAVCVGFTGSYGASLVKVADLVFQAPHASTPRIQELHILAWHAICEIVEAELVSESTPDLALQRVSVIP